MNNQWISVKERLPELSEQMYWYNDDNEQVPWEGMFRRHVLAYDPARVDVENSGIFYARYDRYGWSEVAKFGVSGLVNPTHWMPLPEPPARENSLLPERGEDLPVSDE